MLNILTRSLSFKFEGKYRYLMATALGVCAAFATMPVYSSQSLYSLIIKRDIVQPGAGAEQINGSVGQVHFDNLSMANLAQGVVVDVPLPGGKLVTGRVITSRKNSVRSTGTGPSSGAAAGVRRTIISFDNNAGSVELTFNNNAVTQMMVHDVTDDYIYVADINTSGDGQLRLQDNNDYYCVKFPKTDPLNGIAQRSRQVQAQIPDISTLNNLQSRPGSANVLYLDYWGGTLTDSYWNANYTSNAPINYTAFDRDGDPGSFSSSERYSMWLAWREVVEDFAPFDINITTSRSVYEAAAVTNRSQMIITTTRSWYYSPHGGVALVNIFDDDSEYYKVAWAWNLTDTSMGMTISHEAGHQMGLEHDGIDAQSYYIGHGLWGPIMGAPFGKPYVQWSKGEYPGANQPEDDIAKVTAKLGLISDDAGNGFASSTSLDLPIDSGKRLIGYGDTDTYKFTLSAPGDVDIEVATLLGNEDEARAANLAMNVLMVKLNASGGVESNISSMDSSDNVPLSPLTNVFEYSGKLGAGTYALQISPNSPDTNWATGFGGYANAGEYRLSINADNVGINTAGRPSIDRLTDVGLFIWENAKNNWTINVVSGDLPRVVEFDVLSNLPLTNVLPISIESSDLFIQLSNSLDLSFNVSAPWVDGVKFTMNDQSDTCVSMLNADVPIYLGPDRVLMPPAFDLNTLGQCDPASIKTMGPPSIDRSADTGIFIWESASNEWVVNVVAGDGNGDGGPLVVDLDVVSDLSLNNIVPLSIEPDDDFAVLPNSLDMRLNVNAPWLDGLRFTVEDQSNTCISTTNVDVPIYLGPQRIAVGDNLDLSNNTTCD